MNYTAQSYKTTLDLNTPVGLFYKIRSKYAEVLLLESSDYSSKEDSLSFIVFDAIEGMEASDLTFTTYKPESTTHAPITNFVDQFELYLASFKVEGDEVAAKYNGLFGYTSFDGVRYFDKNLYDQVKPKYDKVPAIKYGFFRYILVLDHVSDTMHIIENLKEGQQSTKEEILSLINHGTMQQFDFQLQGDVHTNQTDEEFKAMVTKCKKHCQRGDVFQIVPSRRYAQGYTGDSFNVYRKLRSINPSPYLFYFDYGTFSIFGSSPEAQMIVKEGVAEIHPIAGTVKRTGDIEADAASAQSLLENPKENAEHIMLVDLARNDLSKNTTGVYVSKYREIQRFSHVFHLVSIVKGKLKETASSYQIFADTFPAGTLSGAPKYKAIQLIDDFEPTKRGYYGGGLGAIFFNGNFNHAIMIRSFLAVDKTLYFQAGAGVVIDSTEEGELQEVNNKLAALRKALIEADNSNSNA